MFTKLIKREAKLNKAKEVAISKGGECLSGDYISAKGKLKWKCANSEHPAWESAYDHVVNSNKWCPECGKKSISNKNKNKSGLEMAKKYAISKGGKCVSDEYSGVKKKLKWCCHKNHEWESSYSSMVINGSWCPKCGLENISSNQINKNGLEMAKKYAISKGGECLSDEYIKSSEKLEWKCNNGHTWSATYGSVVTSDRWCPKCVGHFSKEEFLEMARQHALSKGGECLSNEYVNVYQKLKWKCQNTNHKSWESNYRQVVQRGSWCPECSVYYYKEYKIKDLLEYILDSKFDKVRPIWNINPRTGRPLELDGYSEELKIAFEFQGLHHYETGLFNNSLEDLEYIKYKDEIKKQNCNNNKVKLIIIDDKYELQEEDKILEYILQLLKYHDISINKKLEKKEIEDIFKKLIPHQEMYFIKAKQHAILKGGDCLSTHYINNSNKLTWKCSNPSHPSWEATYYHVVNSGKWCPKCGIENSIDKQKNKNGLDIAKKHAVSKGGECLSNEYFGAHKKLTWKCSNPSHPSWEATYNNVVGSLKRWCPICVKEKRKKVD